MKKNYIQPKAIRFNLETENELLSGSPTVNNVEGNGIQRSKKFDMFEDFTDEDCDFE